MAKKEKKAQAKVKEVPTPKEAAPKAKKYILSKTIFFDGARVDGGEISKEMAERIMKRFGTNTLVEVV